MHETLLESLSLPHRLALSYAPGSARGPVLGLLALDARLAAILRQRTEPVIAQIKLAWWRDRLAEDPVNWPEGEPLLALLQHWPGDTRVLGAMVDGWEALLEEDFGKRIWTVFAEGRARAWTALADGLGVSQPLRPIALAVREWALLDLAAHLGDGDEQAQLRQALAREPWARPRLDRCLRPLAVLHALAQRALHRESAELLDGPGALVLAMRVGIIGR